MYKYLVAFLIIFLIHASAKAGDIDTLHVKQVDLEEVVVRSFKQNKSFRNTPISVSSISNLSIQKKNITDIKDFSATIPNLFLPDYGSKLTSPVYIRGIGSKTNAPGVGLYVDGVPYFERATFDFDFNEVDRIDVLRGPQGTLYGKNSLGGIMNVYTKSPFKYVGTNIKLSAGNYGNIQAAMSHYGNVNQVFGYSVSANYRHTNGYFTNVNPDPTASDKVDKANSTSERIRLSWRITPRLDLHLVSNIDYSMQGGYPYAPYDEQGNWGPINYNDYSSYERFMSTNGFTVDYKGEHFLLNSQTSYQYFDDSQRIDQDFTPASIYFTHQTQKQNMFSEEVNVKSPGNARYKWLFGLFASFQNINREVAMNYMQKDSISDKFYKVPTFNLAVYHQSTFDDLLIDNLSLSAGIRYDIEQVRTRFNFYSNAHDVICTTMNEKRSRTFSQITPKVSLQYNFSPEKMIYGTVTKGYNAGGFNTSFLLNEDPAFDPESSWNYEAGTKLALLNNRIRTEISFFYIDWRNQQVTQVIPGLGNRINNAGKSTSKGIEASLQAKLLRNFNLQISYGFTHATFKEYNKTDKISYAGNYLPYVPSHTFSAYGDYTIDMHSSFLRHLILSAQYTGAGRIYWNEANSASQSYYGVLNGRVSFVTHRFITFDVWIKNATNTTYDAYYFETGGLKLAQRGKPLTFGANLALNF